MRTAYFGIGPTFLHVSSYSKPTYPHGSLRVQLLNPQEYSLIPEIVSGGCRLHKKGKTYVAPLGTVRTIPQPVY